MDHILNHDLVCENPAAATVVGTIQRSMQEIKKNLIRWSFQLLDQIMVKTMRCVSHYTRIRRKRKCKNNIRVLLDRIHKLLELEMSVLIPDIHIVFIFYE